MRFGVSLPQFEFGIRPSPAIIGKVAQTAEAVGFDSLWVSDHVLVPDSRPRYGYFADALTTLAWVGAMTSRIALGTSVLVIPYRHALVLAKQLATLDMLVEGRLILGVAAGWMDEEFELLGLDFAARGRHLDESLAVMQTLWTEPKPRFDGEFYRFSDVIFEPRPHRPEGIPIWVGGHGRVALRRAVRLGVTWHPDDMETEEVTTRAGELRALNGGVGLPIAVRRRADLRAAMGRNVERKPDLPGAWPEGDARPLGGSLQEIIDTLARLREVGVEHFMFQFEHASQPEHLDQIRFAAERICPYFATPHEDDRLAP